MIEIVKEICDLARNRDVSFATLKKYNGDHIINGHQVIFEVYDDRLILSVRDTSNANMLQIGYYTSSTYNTCIYIRSGSSPDEVYNDWCGFIFDNYQFTKILLMVLIVLTKHKTITAKNIFNLFQRYQPEIFITA